MPRRGGRGAHRAARFADRHAARIDGRRSAAITNFWQAFPKAIEVTDGALHLHLFPPRTKGGHELQAGEQKTHTLFLSVHGVGALHAAGAGLVRARLDARAGLLPLDARYTHASASALPYLTPLASDRDPGYQALVRSAIEGPESFVEKRERLDSCGWRHFGDVYGDHEAAFHQGPALLVSHWNNQSRHHRRRGAAVHALGRRRAGGR